MLKWVDRMLRGRPRACADDVGAVVHHIGTLKVYGDIFDLAARAANLVVKPTNCTVVPLHIICDEETRDRIAAIIRLQPRPLGPQRRSACTPLTSASRQ